MQKKSLPPFRFKKFIILHDRCAHKVGTDGVLLGAWIKAHDPKQILDVGTGSGVIALMMAQRFPKAEITAIELDKDSFDQAKENAANSLFADRVTVLYGDFLNFDFPEKFDLIVSNPPFFKGVYSSGNDRRDQARHEFALPQKHFLQKTAELLSQQSQLAVILPKEEARHFIELARPLNLYPLEITKVYGSPRATDKRWLLILSNEFKNSIPGKLYLRDNEGKFSEAYKELTREFYLNP